MRRAAGIAVGVGTHALFALTVWYLFRFLRGWEGTAPATSATSALLVDAFLAVQFAVPHSALLHPAVRERLTRWIPRPFYGCLHCMVTCVSLLAAIFGWQTVPAVVWSPDGFARDAILCAFYGSWAALLYSLHLSGLGYQTGWTPWWHWLRGVPLPPRQFQPKSLYRWMRHPVYLSFLGLIWFNPHFTADRLLLAGLWSVYIFAGSQLKDRRLLYYLGGKYRAYQSRVPGYPFISAGPLARVRKSGAT